MGLAWESPEVGTIYRRGLLSKSHKNDAKCGAWLNPGCIWLAEGILLMILVTLYLVAKIKNRIDFHSSTANTGVSLRPQ